MPLLRSNLPLTSRVTYREAHLYWPTGLNDISVTIPADLSLESFLSLLCSSLASLLFSDPQSTVLCWKSYTSFPWKICLPFILRLPSLMSVRSLCKYYFIKPSQSSLISFPATFSHRPYHHLTYCVFYLSIQLH